MFFSRPIKYIGNLESAIFYMCEQHINKLEMKEDWLTQ